jgi:hypothetical protein
MTKKERIRKKYVLLPPKIAESDSKSLDNGQCGSGESHPFTIRTPAKIYSLLALTMTDPATGWFEIVKATNESETSIQDLFHSTWLARYPRPQFIVFDNGSTGEFKRDFKQMCIQNNYGIKAKPTTRGTTINIQSNATIERVHKVMSCK